MLASINRKGERMRLDAPSEAHLEGNGCPCRDCLTHRVFSSVSTRPVSEAKNKVAYGLPLSAPRSHRSGLATPPPLFPLPLGLDREELEDGYCTLVVHEDRLWRRA